MTEAQILGWLDGIRDGRGIAHWNRHHALDGRASELSALGRTPAAERPLALAVVQVVGTTGAGWVRRS